MYVFIRRPIGGRKFKYFTGVTSLPDAWTDEPTGAYGFRNKETAVEIMKANKPIFGPDDEIEPYKGSYKGKHCPYCNKDNTLRVDGTERQPEGYAKFDMRCTNCNTLFQEKYEWVRMIPGTELRSS